MLMGRQGNLYMGVLSSFRVVGRVDPLALGQLYNLRTGLAQSLHDVLSTCTLSFHICTNKTKQAVRSQTAG